MAFFVLSLPYYIRHMKYGAKTSDYQANESLQYQAYNCIVRSHNGPQKKKNASETMQEIEALLRRTESSFFAVCPYIT